MLGFPPDAVDGATPTLWLQRIHPDDRAQVMSDEGEAKKTGLLDNEYRFLHADGHIVWVRDQARWVVARRTARPASRASSPTSPSASWPSSS